MVKNKLHQDWLATSILQKICGSELNEWEEELLFYNKNKPTQNCHHDVERARRKVVTNSIRSVARLIRMWKDGKLDLAGEPTDVGVLENLRAKDGSKDPFRTEKVIVRMILANEFPFPQKQNLTEWILSTVIGKKILFMNVEEPWWSSYERLQ